MIKVINDCYADLDDVSEFLEEFSNEYNVIDYQIIYNSEMYFHYEIVIRYTEKEAIR